MRYVHESARIASLCDWEVMCTDVYVCTHLSPGM